MGIAEAGHRPSGVRRPLNESWPSNPSRVPDRASIPVTVRLVWDDGEQWVAGRATRWTRHHVFVALAHPRISPVQGVWVARSASWIAAFTFATASPWSSNGTP